MSYQVTANVRTRGAIGMFYWHKFDIQADTPAKAVDAWWSQFSEFWELDHIVSVLESDQS